MADGQQGIAISSGFTLSEDDFIDKDFIQTVLANVLANIPSERRYNGKPIYVLDAADRGLYFMNATKDGFVKLSSTAQSNLTAIIPPTVDNDNTEGYAVGSLWLDTVANEYYRCSDATTGASVWPKTTLTADELATVAVSGDYNDLLNRLILAGTLEGVIQLRNNDGTAFAANDLLRFITDTLIIGETNNDVQITKENISGRKGGAATYSFRGNNGYGEFYLYKAAGVTVIHFDASNSAKINLPIAIGTLSSANANSQVDIVSTTKGFLKPRMSTVQRVALGVLLGNIDADKGMEVYDLDTLSTHSWSGTQWVEEGSGGLTSIEERIMFDSNLDTVRVIYYNNILTFGTFNIDTVRIASLEFETSTDGITWTSHGTIIASGTPPAGLNSWITTNGSGNWYLRLSVVYQSGQTLPTGSQFTFIR